MDLVAFKFIWRGLILIAKSNHNLYLNWIQKQAKQKQLEEAEAAIGPGLRVGLTFRFRLGLDETENVEIPVTSHKQPHGCRR